MQLQHQELRNWLRNPVDTAISRSLRSKFCIHASVQLPVRFDDDARRRPVRVDLAVGVDDAALRRCRPAADVNDAAPRSAIRPTSRVSGRV